MGFKVCSILVHGTEVVLCSVPEEISFFVELTLKGLTTCKDVVQLAFKNKNPQ
jgi:hypothetical protein